MTYFEEVEHCFRERRGGGFILSPRDFALVEVWRDAGIPLMAVLRGINTCFDNLEKAPWQPKRINSIRYCEQEVLQACQQMKEASVGTWGGAADDSVEIE